MSVLIFPTHSHHRAQTRDIVSVKKCHIYAPLLLGLLIQLSSCTQSTSSLTPEYDIPELSDADAAWIGERIFGNECNLKIPCLTSWNEGEDFPSLGIGHFIWYRKNQQEAFVESFPLLLSFYGSKDIPVPSWVAQLPDYDSPWQSSAQFHAELDSPRMIELRSFLNETRAVQAQFIVQRLHQSLPLLLAASDRPQQVEQLFQEIANANPPIGMYALIDYVNFKGNGTAESERYKGQGWGLLQVLENMLDNRSNEAVMPQFAQSARFVLQRRVDNAPPERGEERWLRGWNSRITTYEPNS